MDINTVRKANIRRLVDECASIKAFAQKVGTDPAYVSAILSDKIQRNPGDQFMRRVEKAFDVKHGALDFPDEAAMTAAIVIQSLPEDARRQTLDFIRYKIETAPPASLNQEAAAEYVAMHDELKANEAKSSKRRKG